MRLLRVEVDKATGLQLAHSQLGARGRVAKATVLEESHIASLVDAGVAKVDVVVPDPNEIAEDLVSERLIHSLTWAGCVFKKANGGRYNVYASHSGFVDFARADIDAFNALSEEITLATCLSGASVTEGDQIATLKIIPFYVSESLVSVVELVLQEINLKVRPWQSHLKIGLIQTSNDTITSKIQKKALEVQESRLRAYGINELFDYRSTHDLVGLESAISRATEDALDVLMILGASAICDRHDVVPTAIEEAGGTVIYFGMPVDPGNLLLLGEVGRIKVIGLPGCSRSPAMNGLDLVLDRLMAGLRVSASDIQTMGVGGLLTSKHSRMVSNRVVSQGLTGSA